MPRPPGLRAYTASEGCGVVCVSVCARVRWCWVIVSCPQGRSTHTAADGGTRAHTQAPHTTCTHTCTPTYVHPHHRANQTTKKLQVRKKPHTQTAAPALPPRGSPLGNRRNWLSTPLPQAPTYTRAHTHHPEIPSPTNLLRLRRHPGAAQEVLDL